ncbi:LysR substrate-binding domain-containing protein [Polymorphobacter arshaanensis]|uniref:LysR substrate-binding domain-containing protein n=1 Tax=Glacieibacterium arshaanense TaxID=2511025 RepID=UPI00140DDDE4|nr:LysR substrate-binding domain-containing protein [Polymorphobacter arshaanensis]
MPLRRNIDIDLLRTFVSIVETGSFTRTAERMLRTQSAVSLQVKRLEDALGISLFERGSKPVRISADGEMLLVHARRVLAANDAMVAQMLEPEVRGVVRIGVSDHFSALHLTGLAARFVRAYPQVSLQITCDVESVLASKFADGEFDLMFGQSIASPRRASPAKDGVTRLWHEPMVWFGRDALTTRDKASIPLVVPPAGSTERSAATKTLDGHGRPWHISYASTSTLGLHPAVAAGLGVAALPRSAVDNGTGNHGGIRVLDADSGLPPLPDVEVMLHRGGGAGVAAQRMGDFITAALVGKETP